MSYTVWESQGQGYVLYSVRKSRPKLCLIQCQKVKVKVMYYTVWESQGQSYVLYSVQSQGQVMSYTVWASHGQSYVLYSVR